MQYDPNVSYYNATAIASEENTIDYQYDTRLVPPPITEYHDNSEYMSESRYNCPQNSSLGNESPMLLLHPSSCYSGHFEGRYCYDPDIGYGNVYGHTNDSGPLRNMGHEHSPIHGCLLARDNHTGYKDGEGQVSGRYADTSSN